MGKTYRRDGKFRPKSHGRTFNKDFQPWKKPKRPDQRPPQPQSDQLRDDNQ